MTKSRNFEGKWYCSLTCHVIGATPAALRKHLEGRKLAFARALVAKGEHVPVSEPELEEEEEEEEEAGGGGSGRRAQKAAAAAAAKEKTATKKKASAPPPPPPRTPEEETKGKGSRAQKDASRPSRPKRARRAAA